MENVERKETRGSRIARACLLLCSLLGYLTTVVALLTLLSYTWEERRLLEDLLITIAVLGICFAVVCQFLAKRG